MTSTPLPSDRTVITKPPAACPLCAAVATRPSWLGSTVFEGRQFPFRECSTCGSLYCDPMPDDETLAIMYGPGYGQAFTHDTEITDPKDPARVIQMLVSRPTGVFLDFGCGAGRLLTGAMERGWSAIGIEFDQDVVREVAQRTGAQVVAYFDRERLGPAVADILHLGDVLEHLTDMEAKMPEILSLIKPGGLLIAQGPLENNGNLFVWSVRLMRSLRPRHRTEMAPYHVMLATARGQKALFDRFGLETVVYDLSEVSWPAPNRLSASNWGNPRAVTLFLLRLCSRALTRLRPRVWGNRYFYVGRLP